MPGYRGTIGPQWLVERIENTDNTTNQKTTTENTDNAMQLVLLKIPTILLLLLKIPTSLSIAATLLSLNTQLLTGSFSKYRQHYPLQLVTDAFIIHRHSLVEMCTGELAHESQFKALGRTNLGVVLALSRLVMGESGGYLWRDFNNNICWTPVQNTNWQLERSANKILIFFDKSIDHQLIIINMLQCNC